MSMKICFVCPQAWPYLSDNQYSTGGAERQIVLLAKELAKNHDVYIIVGDYGQSSKTVVENISIYKSYEPGVARYTKRVNKIYSCLDNINPEVSIVRGNPALANVVGTIAKFLETDFVYNIANDNDIPFSGSSRYDYREYIKLLPLKLADHLIVQTPRQRHIISENRKKTSIVPNGYPSASVQRDQEYDGFLWIGRLDFKQKQPDIFVNLAERIPSEKFTMIGPRNNTKQEKKMLEKINQMDNITYQGPVQPDAVHDYYARTQALINTSAYEGFPNTYLEAWRLGIPVLSFNVDPNRFINCELPVCAHGNMERLIEIVRKVGKSDMFRNRLAENCLNEFEQRYRIEAVAETYLEALRNT